MKEECRSVIDGSDDGYRRIAFRVREELYTQYKVILLQKKPRLNTTQDLRNYMYEVVQKGSLLYFSDKDFINFKRQYKDEPYTKVNVRLEENEYEKFKEIAILSSTRPAYALEDRINWVVFKNIAKTE